MDTILVFYVNGKKIIDNNPDPEQTLLPYLRNTLELCGTKLGCGEGGCGACTVMLSRVNRVTGDVEHLAVNACLIPVCAVHGMAVTTVEGIGSIKTKLHSVQERIAKAHGTQCGFCTPGIVMSMYALLRSNSKPSMKDMEVAFQGNLCRCTGYRPIIEGYRTFTVDGVCGMGDQCCKVNGTKCADNGTTETAAHSSGVLENEEDNTKLFQPNKFTPFDQSQESIFPPELKLSDIMDKQNLVFRGERVTWLRPNSLTELLQIKKDFPDAKIIVGNTEVGIEIKFKNFLYPVLVCPTQVFELSIIKKTDDGVEIGAAVTLWELESVLNRLIQEYPEYKTRLYRAIVKMLQLFAGKQIRNVASVGGNIMTGSPISDLNPIFTAAGIKLEVQSLAKGRRTVSMGPGFFTGYRRNIIESAEVLISLLLPFTVLPQHFVAYKQSKRRVDDIAIVNIAVNVFFEPESDRVHEMSLAFGGIGKTIVLASQTSHIAKGKIWDNSLVELINDSLSDELPLDPGAVGGMILYRRSLTLSLFFKVFLSISQALEESFSVGRTRVPIREKSGSCVFETLAPKSTQAFEQRPDSQSITNPIGRPHIHASAYQQATGEATYVDDMPRFRNEVYVAFVLSSKAHAKIIDIDASLALAQAGTHGFFCAKDIEEGKNVMESLTKDEEILASGKVYCHGQRIGFVIGDTQEVAQRAAKLVRVTYEELVPIITIEDAITHESYFTGSPKVMKSGDVSDAFETADCIIEGHARIGGQEHFYLETQVTLVIPKDQDEVEVFSSAQDAKYVQQSICNILNLPASKVIVRSKRLGGAFGGKENRAALVAVPVAFAAYKLNRPARCMLDRDEDMVMTGGRNPFYIKYKVAFTQEGLLKGLEVEMYNNAGWTLEASGSVMEFAMMKFLDSFFVPNVLIKGWVCRTNLPSNTALRGFGMPQGAFATELIIRDVARKLGKDYLEIVQMNMMREGQTTHYNQIMENDNLFRCFEECIRSSGINKRRLNVNEFNSQNRWKKRGISMVTINYGNGFSSLFAHQGGALVHIYIDGSVLITHGGTEMGQGLHTKMIQVAANALNIPFERIHISEAATDKIPNATVTAASYSSDIYGIAVLNACNTLLERLKPIIAANPAKDWNCWIKSAFLERISLSATGFHITTGIGPNTNRKFDYYTCGVGCSEVEIDCLTGDHQVIRTDIVMDLGQSINPAIDIGQIEGAFMQGYGLFSMEEMIYSPTGAVLSRGPGMYKIPGFGDIPGEFNVSLLKGPGNPRAVFSSRAIGEPPLFSGASVFFAIKEAIVAARKDENLDSDFDFVSPATAARIRMACQDRFTAKFKMPQEHYTPWNVVV